MCYNNIVDDFTFEGFNKFIKENPALQKECRDCKATFTPCCIFKMYKIEGDTFTFVYYFYTDDTHISEAHKDDINIQNSINIRELTILGFRWVQYQVNEDCKHE